MNKFWQNKNVFVTGHTGFKGAWLVLWLKALGANVTGYALAPNTFPNLFTEAKVNDDCQSIIGDISNQDYLTQQIKKANPDIIFHLAAQPLVSLGYDDPIQTYQTNVMGTVYLLDAVRHLPNIRAVLVVTSDKCYQNREWVWGYREKDTLGGKDPYSNSKACAELITDAYRQSYFAKKKCPTPIAVGSARAGNVIGGGDFADQRLIPDLMRAFSQNNTAYIRHPHAKRPWQYVIDVLKGYLLLAEKLYENNTDFSEAWNFGPPLESCETVSFIANYIKKLWGKNAAWETIASHYEEATILQLDSHKAYTRLKWSPDYTLVKALEITHDWYQHFYHDHHMGDFTRNQLTQYQKERHD